MPRRARLEAALCASSILSGWLALAGCSSEADPGEAAGIETPDAGTGPTEEGGGGGIPNGTIQGAIRRYDYAFDLTTSVGRSRLTYDVAPPGGDCLEIASRAPSADEPTWAGVAANSATLDKGALRMCGEPVADGPLEIGARTKVPLKRYFGLDIGYSRQPDLGGGNFSYLLSWVGGCDLFGPCDRDPSRLATLHFDVTHPEGTVVLCPGKLTAGATSTQCEVTGAPTYSGFAIAADPLWKRAPFTSAAGVDLVLYEVPGGKIGASLDAASVREFLVWITDLLGPMPYGSELRVAGAPTKWLGFEHPANIILTESIPDQTTAHADPTMHVLMHEIVHQWAGDRTTLAAVADFVWKEATAEYLSYVFEDEKRPAGEAAKTRAYWDSISIQSKHRPRPTDGPRVEEFYGDVYGPGPMVLYLQLETMLGRPTVLAAIKAFLSAPGARSVDDLRVALEKASSQDLTKYFEAWVVGAGAPEWPTFAVALEPQGDQLTVKVTQENPSGILYGCKVDVAITGATTARAIVDFGLAPTSATAETSIAFSGAVTKTTIDPDHKLVGRTAVAKNGLARRTTEPETATLPVWIY